MLVVRAVGVVYGVVQVLTFYRPHPPGMLPWALALLVVMAAGNLVVGLAMRRVRTIEAARRLGVGALTLDSVVLLGFVFLYTFDPETAIWALLYLLPLEGAIRFQRVGALTVMGAATIVYSLREVYGAAVYGNEFLLTSISFRMGIGFLIAMVAGTMASNLVRDRDELEVAKTAVENYAGELAGANLELQRAARMRDDFLAMTNHELRTPLTAVVGYASTLVDRWDEVPDERRREFVESIRLQATRLQGLVEDLLTLSSLQSGAVVPQIETVDLPAAVDEAVATVGAADEVDNRCPRGLTVRADPQRLSQILTNYLTNALKYGAAPVIVEARSEDGSVEIRVRDHGPGVSENFAPRLFETFSRSTEGSARTVKGTGLGLAIVRLLAEAQSGQAWYEPAPTGGSVFCLRLTGQASERVAGPTAGGRGHAG